jgi:hypothetical protein
VENFQKASSTIHTRCDRSPKEPRLFQRGYPGSDPGTGRTSRSKPALSCPSPDKFRHRPKLLRYNLADETPPGNATTGASRVSSNPMWKNRLGTNLRAALPNSSTAGPPLPGQTGAEQNRERQIRCSWRYPCVPTCLLKRNHDPSPLEIGSSEAARLEAPLPRHGRKKPKEGAHIL